MGILTTPSLPVLHVFGFGLIIAILDVFLDNPTAGLFLVQSIGLMLAGLFFNVIDKGN